MKKIILIFLLCFIFAEVKAQDSVTYPFTISPNATLGKYDKVWNKNTYWGKSAGTLSGNLVWLLNPPTITVGSLNLSMPDSVKLKWSQWDSLMIYFGRLAGKLLTAETDTVAIRIKSTDTLRTNILGWQNLINATDSLLTVMIAKHLSLLTDTTFIRTKSTDTLRTYQLRDSTSQSRAYVNIKDSVKIYGGMAGGAVPVTGSVSITNFNQDYTNFPKGWLPVLTSNIDSASRKYYGNYHDSLGAAYFVIISVCVFSDTMEISNNINFPSGYITVVPSMGWTTYKIKASDCANVFTRKSSGSTSAKGDVIITIN